MNKDNAYRAFTQELGFKLRMMRDSLRLNASDAANKFGVSNSLVASYESGKETPNLLYLDSITRACGLKLEDLLIDKNELVKKLYLA